MKAKFIFVIKYYGTKTKEIKVVDFYRHGKYTSYRTEDGKITSILDKNIRTITLIEGE